MFLVAVGGIQARTLKVDAGAGAEARLQAALAEAKDGDVIALGAGLYELTATLKMSTPGVTLQGAGPDQTRISFAQKPASKDLIENTGIVIAGDRLVLRDFALSDSKGPGIGGTVFGTEKISPLIVDNITFKNLLLERNQIRLTAARHVLFDKVTARDTFSGIQTTTSEYVIVRNCTLERNHVGLEVENDYFVDIYDNVARDNVGGIMMLDMPMYNHINGHSIRVFRNKVLDNNKPSKFPTGIGGTMRTGTGILVMGGESDIHIFDNDISGNGHANITIVALPWQIDNPDFNAIPNDIVVRNNRFGPSGFAPQDNLAAVKAAGGTLPDVIWDGATTFIGAGQIKTSPPLRLTIKDNMRTDGMPVGFLSLGLTIANGGMLFSEPTAKLPEPAKAEEPAPVRLPQDNVAG